MLRNIFIHFPRNSIITVRGLHLYPSLLSPPPADHVVSRADTPQPEIFKYFDSAGQHAVKSFPPNLLRRKVSSDDLYVTNPKWAEVIINHLNAAETKAPIVELNPGIGILTRELLDKTKTTIHCLESQKVFKQHMEDTFMENIDRMTYSEGDLMKIDVRDSLDNGERILKFLGTEKKAWEDDPCVKIVGGVGTPDFFKHLINSLVFQNNLFSQGRCEFLLFVTPSVLLRYICNERAGYFSYRPRAVLFQMLFEYEMLELLPRKDFLPWVNCPKKNSKLSKLNEIHPEYLYLVRIIPRRDLFSVCPVEHLCTLSFFVKQVMSSGKHRVIPYLEKWIENCGARIILNSGNTSSGPDPPPVINGEKLPVFVNRSRPDLLVPGKSLPNVNIFSEFGEISPQHIFHLFHEFINWPEYKDSSFISLMQQHYMKMTERKDGDDRL